MAASGFTPISLYYSTTASAVPTSGNLANGELGLNIADMKLYAKNSAGTVTLLASNSGASGSVTSVAVSGGSTGLTTSGGPITTSGTITLAGTLGTANGGTGLTSFTSGGVVYASGTGTLATGSALQFNNTNEFKIVAATGTAYNRTESTQYSTFVQHFATSGGAGVEYKTLYRFVNTDAGEAMRLTSGGNLVIGATTANAKLSVNTTTYTGVTNGEQVSIEGTTAWSQGLAFSMWSAGLYNSGYPSGYIGVPNTSNGIFISGGAAVVNDLSSSNWAKTLNNTAASIISLSNGGLVVYANSGLTANTAYTPTERLTFSSAGNLAVGTTTTSLAKITASSTGSNQTGIRLNNSSNAANNYVSIDFGMEDLPITSGYSCFIRGYNSGAVNYTSYLTFGTNGNSATAPTEAGRFSSSGGFSVGTTADPGAGAIYATGNITAYYSDKRLKTVSGKIENALDKVAQLSGVYYTNNSVAKSFGYDSDEVQVGVLAQDVEAVLPQIVKAAPFDLDQDGNSKSGENYKTVQYERLVPLLIEAINELQAKVKALEAK